MLTIVGEDMLLQHSTGKPSVTVCAGVPCVLLSDNATHLTCRMPACSVAATAPLAVHVPPLGFAVHPDGSDLSVRGMLSITSVRLALSSNTSTALAEGSGWRCETHPAWRWLRRFDRSNVGRTRGPNSLRAGWPDPSSPRPGHMRRSGVLLFARRAFVHHYSCRSTFGGGRKLVLGSSERDERIVSGCCRRLTGFYWMLPIADSMVISHISPSAGSTAGG